MLSLVHVVKLSRMHKTISIFVSIATFCPSVVLAGAPVERYDFRDRPTIKEVEISPSYSDLFKPLYVESPQPSLSTAVVLTGISSSSGVPFAHLEYQDSHLYAKIGQMLPDGSQLVSIDLSRGNITTKKKDSLITHTLTKYE